MPEVRSALDVTAARSIPTLEDENDLDALREELARVALGAARELISSDPEMERVEVLDAQAAVLRERIKKLTPPRRDVSDLWC